jgi:hypothetical protein
MALTKIGLSTIRTFGSLGVKFVSQWVHYMPLQLCGLCIFVPLDNIFGDFVEP